MSLGRGGLLGVVTLRDIIAAFVCTGPEMGRLTGGELWGIRGVPY